MNPGDRRLLRRNPSARTATVAIALGTACLTLASGASAGKPAGGGTGVAAAPAVKDVTCAQRCLDVRTVTESGRITLSGSHLEGVVEVKFPGDGQRITQKAKSVTATTVSVKVPKGAESGRPRVVTDYGAVVASPVEIEIEPAGAIEDVGGFSVARAEVTPAKTFFDGKRASSLSYLFKADGPADIRIDVVSKSTGEVIDSVVKRNQKPFANYTADWDGLLESGGIAGDGDYRFRVSQLSGGAGASARFSFYDHIFPLRGKHSYGDGLGSGRGHEGQDVFAKCGTKIVAARGGRVQVSEYHSAAGYYVVVDGAKTGKDYMYAHMEKAGRPKVGTRVKTGEVIGRTSDTGRASGCHLHFELWSAPGWYEGGHVLNPTKPLKAWDKYS